MMSDDRKEMLEQMDSLHLHLYALLENIANNWCPTLQAAVMLARLGIEPRRIARLLDKSRNERLSESDALEEYD